MMSQTDRRIHDYLDGRMARADRIEFERRMGQDVELLARVEEFRRIGDALRTESAELSPGFFSRARAEFETRSAGSLPYRFRLVSWEAAGLVVAAALAVAVFVPGVLEEGPARLPVESLKEVAAPASEQELQKKKSDLDEAATGNRLSASPPAAEPPADVPARRAREEIAEKQEQQITPAAELSKPATRDELRGTVARAKTEGFANAPSTDQVVPIRVIAHTLPAGTVALGEFRAGALEGAVRKNADEKDSESSLDDRQTAERYVLIGPREQAFSCVGVTVRRSGQIWVIMLPEPSPERPATETGCAVPLPDDGTGFEIESPSR